MSPHPEWLPPLVPLTDWKGNWDAYLNAIYEYFRQDFVDSTPSFEERRVSIRRYPLSEGKESSFWHIISEGRTEDDRIPNLRRCERIRWPRPIIDNHQDGTIKTWKNKRSGDTRVCLWLENCDYLVVLAERRAYYLLITAYCIDQPHTRRKLQQEFENYWRSHPLKG